MIDHDFWETCRVCGKEMEIEAMNGDCPGPPGIPTTPHDFRSEVVKASEWGEVTVTYRPDEGSELLRLTFPRARLEVVALGTHGKTRFIAPQIDATDPARLIGMELFLAAEPGEVRGVNATMFQEIVE